MPSLPKMRCFAFQYDDERQINKMGAMKSLFTQIQMDMLTSAETLITASNSSDPNEMGLAIYNSLKLLNPHLALLTEE